MPEYRVLAGLDYAGVRREVGDVVSDIPRQSIGWLVDQGLIEIVKDEPVDKPADKLNDTTKGVS